MRVRVDHATRVRPLRARELEAREEALPGTYRGPGGERAPARRLVPGDRVRAWLSETPGDPLGHAGRVRPEQQAGEAHGLGTRVENGRQLVLLGGLLRELPRLRVGVELVHRAQQLDDRADRVARSEERRVGKECRRGATATW